jgi:adenylate cyclase
MAQVIVEQPGVSPTTVPLTKPETRFGRSEESDIVLVADEVSRHHAKIFKRGNQFMLEDLNSLNGTYVNRQRIKERVLSHLDEVWFGSKCRLVFHNDAPAKSPSSTLQNDSDLLRNMNRIREEMDRVANNMTMIGQRSQTSVPLPEKATQITSDEVQKMGRAYRRLSALYKASQVMASAFDLDSRLSQLLDVVIEVMDAERGFVMLCDPGRSTLSVKVARQMGRELEASSPSMGIAGRAAIDGEPVLMADRDQDSEFGMRESIIRNQIRSAMCVPLRIENRVLGSVYIDTTKSVATFSEEDLELFLSLASQSAMAIDNVRLHNQIIEEERRRQNLGRFLSPAIVEKIMNEGSELELGGRKQAVTTMFADIRSSSKLAEGLPPYELVELLNEHFTHMTDIVFDHGGTLDKYIGDELMAIFGAPLVGQDDALRAVRCAAAMQERNQALNIERQREGRQPIEIGIGIETGEVIAGYIGSLRRMEFTVVGDRVNMAKRFCDMAGPGSVVLGDATWGIVQDRVVTQPIGTVMLKGKQNPAQAHQLVSIKP